MAGQGYKVWSAGDVLAASDVMGYLMDQSVGVYASSGARGSAIGTAVSEGMITYLKDTDTLEAYNGSTWVAVGSPALTANRAVATNGSGALVASSVTATELGYLSGVTSAIQTQLDAKTPGMVKVGATSFTAASTASINNVFSATYKNYKAFIQTTLGTSGANGNLRFRTSGTDNSTSNYNTQSTNIFGTSQTITQPLSVSSFYFGDFDAQGSSTELTFFNPFATAKTYYQGHGMYKASQPEINLRSGGFNATTSFDGFTIYPTTSTITGTITVYGLVD
jgi:hypothetical protein